MSVVLLAAFLAQDFRADLGGLLDQLGSDSVQERDDASAILLYIGEPALPDLDRATESGDSEVAARSRGLVAAIAPHRTEALREMAHLFAHACGTFRAGRLAASIDHADGVLRIDPDYAPARRLREVADRALQEEGARERFLGQVERWREETREEIGRLPESPSIRYPSRASWLRIAKHIRPEVHPHDAWVSENCIAIHRKLDTMKIDLAFENTKLEYVLAFIRDFSALNLVLDAAVYERVDLERSITLKVKDLVLKNALKLLLAPFGLDYVITEQQVVLLTDPKRICNRDEF